MTRIGFLVFLVVYAVVSSALASAAEIRIVAAENFYGDVARQIAGPEADVVSILSNPDQDPHLFEASVATALALSHAQIVVASGADYDPWMEKLLSATPTPGRATIVVADLIGKKPGDNPHIWYDPDTMKVFAARLEQMLAARDPAHAAQFARGEAAFLASLEPIERKIADMRSRFSGEAVAASEPVFGYMAQKLGLKMRDGAFALAVQNDVEPSASDVAGFEDDIVQRRIKAFIYNRQASEPLAQNLEALARRHAISIVGVTETEPGGATYQSWMMQELSALDLALSAQANR